MRRDTFSGRRLGDLREAELGHLLKGVGGGDSRRARRPWATTRHGGGKKSPLSAPIPKHPTCSVPCLGTRAYFPHCPHGPLSCVVVHKKNGSQPLKLPAQIPRQNWFFFDGTMVRKTFEDPQVVGSNLLGCREKCTPSGGGVGFFFGCRRKNGRRKDKCHQSRRHRSGRVHVRARRGAQLGKRATQKNPPKKKGGRKKKRARGPDFFSWTRKKETRPHR